MRAPMGVTFYNRSSRFWRRNVPTLLNQKHPITEGLPLETSDTSRNPVYGLIFFLFELSGGEHRGVSLFEY